ncbi:hypothetical protein LI034_14445 [Clostridium perfringens]|uniref:hypothetical protein n=1 Tax=Clostridium perfringens TaxID=1502 RepID=UPI00103CDFD5|nr:hypothetical protein [Clostridium perfringens]EJT5925418.1 hypothetical protein [Clostridium perfringens]MBO3378986.1 hypothetical protein [Clostridium perfringens]MCX0362198.1 hypothetical protein [Clostridium perfringens]MDK0784658.1 hypothetical protein [Clostridium perfringens]MDK0846229.1 hypothetical protein [Clostridium perfringens]
MKISKAALDSPLKCLFLMLFIHPAQSCISSILNFYGIPSGYLMTLLYLCTFIYGIWIIIKINIKKIDFIIYILIILFYMISYNFATDDAKLYFWSSDMKVMYLFYMPLSIFLVSRIYNWENLFKNRMFLVYSDLLIALSLVSKVLTDDWNNYMSYSYNLLPFWCIVLIAALYNKKHLQWIFVLISIVEGIIYGSRGAIIWLIICGVSIFFVQIFNKKNGIKIFFRYATILIISFGVFWIVSPKIMSSPLVQESYILRRITYGNLTVSSGRTELSIECRNIISRMGFNIYGLFYDRTVLSNGWYSHNIIYEVLISFGWFLGILFLCLIFGMIISTFFGQTEKNKIVVIFLLSSFFLRYFLSGSIFDEANFLILIGGIISLNRIKKNNRIRLQDKGRE